jgi:hypothetical protein
LNGRFGVCGGDIGNKVGLDIDYSCHELFAKIDIAQQRDFMRDGKDFAEIVKLRDRDPFVPDEDLAICVTQMEAALATRNPRFWSQRMKINQHIVGMGRHSRSGIFLSDRCSGAFLNHIARAALLAVVVAAIIVLVTG